MSLQRMCWNHTAITYTLSSTLSMRDKLNGDFSKKGIKKRKAKPGPELNQESKSPDSWHKVAIRISSTISAIALHFILYYPSVLWATGWNCLLKAVLTGFQIKESQYWILEIEESQRNQSSAFLEEEVPCLEFPAVGSHSLLGFHPILKASPTAYQESPPLHSRTIYPSMYTNFVQNLPALCGWGKNHVRRRNFLSRFSLESSLLHTPSAYWEPAQHSLPRGSKHGPSIFLLSVFSSFLVFILLLQSLTLAQKIPWTEEPGRLQSMGWQRVRHD